MNFKEKTLLNSFFCLFANCIPVTGYLKSAIYDIQRSDYCFIPHELYNILIKYNKHRIKDVFINTSDTIDKKELEYYFNFLFKKEFIFLASEEDVDLFPLLDLTWETPNLITNVIVEYSLINLSSIQYLKEIKNYNLAIRFDVNSSYEEINSFLISLSSSSIKHIELIIDYTLLCEKKIKDLINKHLRVNKVVLYSAPSKQIKNYKKKAIVIHTTKTVNFCNKLRGNKLTKISIPMFTESQKYHTYFNSKLYIGKKGEIKNAPECEDEFGFIQNLKGIEDLKKIISKSEFQKYWLVDKKSCDVCKDCELKYMCVDNRLPYQREGGSWYHKEECNYNPYICKWKGEEGYQTLEECGVITDERGYSRDDDKIKGINEQLWA